MCVFLSLSWPRSLTIHLLCFSRLFYLEMPFFAVIMGATGDMCKRGVLLMCLFILCFTSLLICERCSKIMFLQQYRANSRHARTYGRISEYSALLITLTCASCISIYCIELWFKDMGYKFLLLYVGICL